MRRAALRSSELRAVELLCDQGLTSVFDLTQLNLTRLRLPVEVSFDSFAGFCAKTGTDRAAFAPHVGADGLTVRAGGTYLVLYDERVESPRRRAFTLAHEIGHILLAHEGGEHAATEEREANAFAASLLAPAVAVRYLAHRRGCPISTELIAGSFFLSREAAALRARDLLRAESRQPATYEIMLLLQLFGKLS